MLSIGDDTIHLVDVVPSSLVGKSWEGGDNPAHDTFRSSMIVYTAALPNKECQQYIDRIYPSMRYMLSPMCMRSFGASRYHIVKRGYAIDNGAYGYYLRKQPFNDKAFYKVLDEWSIGADWVAIPDKVGDWYTTLSNLNIWLPRLEGYGCALLVVVQDGCELDNYTELMSVLSDNRIAGIFVGGTTEWKLSNLDTLSMLCHSVDKTIHVGRVNSGKRIRLCHSANVDSVDGSGMSRFRETTRIVCDTIVELNNQMTLF